MNGWKISAITMMVFFLVTLLLFYNYVTMINNIQDERLTCADNVCEIYDSFSYTPSGFLCECYEGGEVVYQEEINKGG